MKANLSRNLVATTALLAGLTGTPSALAQPLFETLGTGAGATDRYTVTCGAGTFRLSGTVTDLVPATPSLVSMQFSKGSGATNTTDFSDGPLANPAPSAVANTIGGGPGDYTVLVDKAGGGAENYMMDVECKDINYAPLPTTVLLTQDL